MQGIACSNFDRCLGCYSSILEADYQATLCCQSFILSVWDSYGRGWIDDGTSLAASITEPSWRVIVVAGSQGVAVVADSDCWEVVWAEMGLF